MDASPKTREQLTEAILAALSEDKVFRTRKGRLILRRKGWRDVAKKLYPQLRETKEINARASVLWKIVNDPKYHPGAQLCQDLGIIEPILIHPCNIHGIVHCFDCETHDIFERNG